MTAVPANIEKCGVLGSLRDEIPSFSLTTLSWVPNAYTLAFAGRMRFRWSLLDRQRNGRAKEIIGIVVPLGFDEPLGVAAIAFRRAVRVTPRK